MVTRAPVRCYATYYITQRATPSTPKTRNIAYFLQHTPHAFRPMFMRSRRTFARHAETQVRKNILHAAQKNRAHKRNAQRGASRKHCGAQAAQALRSDEHKPRGGNHTGRQSDAWHKQHTPQTSHFEQRQGRAKHHTLSNAHNLTTDNLSTRHVHKLLITMPSCKQVINKLSTWR